MAEQPTAKAIGILALLALAGCGPRIMPDKAQAAAEAHCRAGGMVPVQKVDDDKQMSRVWMYTICLPPETVEFMVTSP